ncbi:MAG: efflux RND transporter permease subunit, partial [Bacteroidota bacterium]
PRSEKPQFQINIELPQSASFPETDEATRFVEAKLATVPEVKYFTSNVGKGNPTVYYNVSQRRAQSNFAQVFVQLDVETYEAKVAVMEQLKRDFKYYPKAKLQVIDYEQGPPLEAPVAIRVFGNNLDTLRQLSIRVGQIIEDTPGTMYLFNPMSTRKTNLRFRINKEKAGMLGIPTATIDQTIRMAIAGLPIAQYSPEEGADNINITVTLPRARFANMDVFDQLYVNTLTGAAVPLNQVVELEYESEVGSIRHIDEARYTTVNAYAKEGYQYAALNQDIIAQLETLDFPKGYYYEAAGAVENQDDAFEGVEITALISAVLFLLILILEFGSFKSSLIVLSVIPLGLIGAFVALYWSSNPLSFTALVGFIALIGIEIKNSILLVDFTNQLRREGLALEAAIEQAAKT